MEKEKMKMSESMHGGAGRNQGRKNLSGGTGASPVVRFRLPADVYQEALAKS